MRKVFVHPEDIERLRRGEEVECVLDANGESPVFATISVTKKSYVVQPDLTDNGLDCLKNSIKKIMRGESGKIDLGHGTVVHRTRAKSDGSYDIVVNMRIEEEQIC